MNAPPPPYSESPYQGSPSQPAPIKRKPLPPSDTKVHDHAGYGHDDASDDDGFDIDDYYLEDPPVKQQHIYQQREELQVQQPHVEQSYVEQSYVEQSYVEQSNVEQSNVEQSHTERLRRPDLSIRTLNISARTHSSPAQLHPNTAGTPLSTAVSPSSPTPSFLSATGSAVTLPLTPDSANAKPTSAAQKAFRDARHFAGGIIQRPAESTKHFTIVRHSHGLVFYQGNSTSLAITIFSDEPLPADRTLWLQKKGWSGKTGMRLKGIMGLDDSWLDVTPTTEAIVEQLNPSDERAWQRDISKFRKKGAAKIRDKHLPRQTVIVKIPEGSGDGYFLIVLCSGIKKKVLCQSPVFRVISASRSPASLKGAPIWALPLELGAMAGATALNLYAKNTVGRVTAVAKPVASVATSSATKFMPKSLVKSQIASKAYGYAGDAFTSAISEGNTRYHETRDRFLVDFENSEAILEEGPKAPYPLTFRGRSEIGITNMLEELDMPNFGLTEVSDQILQQLHGYYFGWARIYQKKSKEEAIWCQAFISVTMMDTTQMYRMKIGQAPTKAIALRLMTDYEDLTIEQGVKFEVVVLGFIRPDEPAQRAGLEKAAAAGDQDAIDAALISEFNDVSMAQQFLDHPSWSAEVGTRPKLEERKSSGLQKLSETYINTRMAAQKHIDRVPLHKIGVRLDGDKNRNETHAVSGFYVLR